MCLVIGAAAAWLALQQPWLGIKLATNEKRDAVVVEWAAPHLVQLIPVGATVLQLVSATGQSLDLQVSDLIEEPDFFDTYPEMAEFFARQSVLHEMLHSGEVKLIWKDKNGTGGVTAIMPQERPLAYLTGVFWFQLFAGFAGLTLSVWIFLLRRDDWGARMFALTGLMFPLATTSAAIYSVRELAFPGDMFRLFSSLNHTGAMLFGCALVALFLSYPRMLVRPRTLFWLPAVFGVWLLTDIYRIAPDQDWGTRFPIMLEMLLAMLFAVVQWRKSRNQPLDRAALRWFILSTVVGCSLFVISVPAASALGYFPPLSQGYSFGFFLIMYVGIALGLRRYRLFDLDEWAYRILLWVAGAMAVLAMDALLIFAGVGQFTSLGITLLLCGWLYFPFRQWLWQRLVSSNAVAFESLLPELSGIAFIVPATERERRWDDLLLRMFDPLEMSKCAPDDGAEGVRADGLALYLPASGGLQPRLLRYAGRGTRLFSSRDSMFAHSLCHLMEQVATGREAYQRGVEQERLRIAHDLHDNIGARLLKLIHHLRGTPGADIARDAMKDLRTAINAIDALPVPFANALADWRAETDSRCKAAGVHMDWVQGETLPEIRLQPRVKASLESILREAVTNALKHAAPEQITVQIGIQGLALCMSIENDGKWSVLSEWKEGYGLRNIRSRLNDLGGTLGISELPTRARMVIEVPVGSLT